MAGSDEEIQAKLFRAMIDRSSEGLVVVDPDNQIRFWNRAAELLFDLTTEEFSVHRAVRSCALPRRDEFRPSDAEKPLGLAQQNCGSKDENLAFNRVVEPIEIDGQQWLLVRLGSGNSDNQSDAELRRLACTDELSNLFNRRGFQSALEENLHRQLALAIVDVDFFKRINDNRGHEIGDQAIQWIAEILLEEFPDALCVGRLGGDEFGVVLEVSDHLEVESRFRQLCTHVGSRTLEWYPEGITISIGVSIAKSPGVSARTLLSLADQAMYRSKAAGRNQSTSVEV